MKTRAALDEPRTARFERRRAEILDVASNQINENGLYGLTLRAVARALGFDTSSVTYYFRFKEELAAACLQRSLDCLSDFATIAAREPDRDARVRRFIADGVSLFRKDEHHDSPQLVVISEMAALDEPIRAPLYDTYRAAFRTVRGFFDDMDGATGSVAASTLIANATWMAAWVARYNCYDFDRLSERLSTVLLVGLEQGESWPVELTPLEAVDEPQIRFLHAATNLINRHGYKGASVEKIAGELGVSVGSFYHHLEGKDELVVACFSRSFEIMDRARQRAEASTDRFGQRLGMIVSQLLAFQFAAESPLLRASAFQALPPDLREKMMTRTQAFTLHIAGLIADGVAEGSIRPVDPLIASQCVLAMIHAAPDLRTWASKRTLREAVDLTFAVLRRGLGKGHEGALR